MMIQNSEHYVRVMLLGNRMMNFSTQLSFSCQSWLEWVCRFNGVFLSFVLKVLSGIFMVTNATATTFSFRLASLFFEVAPDKARSSIYLEKKKLYFRVLAHAFTSQMPFLLPN